jgi:hypothetical protein
LLSEDEALGYAEYVGAVNVWFIGSVPCPHQTLVFFDKFLIKCCDSGYQVGTNSYRQAEPSDERETGKFRGHHK